VNIKLDAKLSATPAQELAAPGHALAPKREDALMPCPACGNLMAYSVGSCLKCEEESGGEESARANRDQNPSFYRVVIFLCAMAAIVLLVALL
jgi:predicted RNA-binding Zn-ribbon protein involved in translation (DUF1610 family)